MSDLGDKRRGAARLIEQAADLIDLHGHHKGGVGNVEVGFCIYGAIDYAATDTEVPLCIVDVAESVIERHVHARGFVGVVPFNDDPDRSKAEILRFLREVSAETYAAAFTSLQSVSATA